MAGEESSVRPVEKEALGLSLWVSGWAVAARLPKDFSVPILYVSHSMEEILNLADTMVIMESGRAVAVGTTEDLAQQCDFRSVSASGKTSLVCN